ncbi:DUF6512 family protein [Faecalimonas sp.]
MQSLKSVHIIGAIFTIIAGTILHFVWEWSGQSNLTAIFSAVNESTWEHLKLLFFPFITFAIVEYFLYGKKNTCFFSVKVCSVLLGMLTIVTAFYTYTGILGRNYFPLDILTFLLGVIVSYLYSYHHLYTSPQSCSVYSEMLAVFTLILFIIAFAIFSFTPPSLGIFQQP